MDISNQNAEAKFSLRRSLQVVPLSESELYLYSQKGTSYHLKTERKDLLQIVSTLMRGVTWAELASFVESSDGKDLETVRQILFELAELGVLQRTVMPTGFKNTELDRFEREIGYFGEFETPKNSRYDYLRHLRDAHVLMIGLGSLGSWALQHFVACGVGCITGVDMDIIESSNLARQSLYHEADIGKTKVEAAAHAVEALSSFTKFSGFQRQVTSSQDIQKLIEQAGGVSLIVLTADVPIWKISCWAAEAALVSGIPLLRANRIGVGPFMLPGQTACPACAWPRLVDEIPDAEQMVEYQRSLQGIPASALSTQTSVSGALLAEEAVAYLSGAGHVRTYDSVLRMNINGNKYFTLLPFPRDLRCPVCGE